MTERLKELDPNGRVKRIVCSFDYYTYQLILKRVMKNKRSSVAAEIRAIVRDALERDAKESSS